MKTRTVNIFLGLFFGYVLGRAGVAEFHHIEGMFLLQDFHMYGVLGTAVPVAGLLIWLMERKKMTGGDGLPLRIARRRRHPGNIPGGILFGIGWAITGACPGTSFVQVGTGHLLGLATVAGIFLGLILYPRIHQRFFNWVPDSC